MNVGDVLHWEHQYSPWSVYDGDGYSYTYKDSISESYVTADTVRYKIIRTKGNTVTTKTLSYYSAEFLPFYKFDAYPFVLASSQYEPFSQEVIWQKYYGVFNDTISSISCLVDYNYYSSACNNFETFDQITSFGISTTYGVSNYEDSRHADNRHFIRGSIIDGDTIGDISIITSIKNREIGEIYTFPNPANEKIFIDLPYFKDNSYLIFDVNGIVVKEGKLDSDELQIDFLSDGLYFLKVKNDEQLFMGKFVKE
ncbi:MAG: T9SS type A sorting domain-containing protein [Chitinophagales bacterium]